MGLLYLLLNGVEEPDIFVYLFIYVIIYSVNNLVKLYARTHALTSGVSFALQLLFFFPVALRPNAGHGLLILQVSRSHTTTHYSR
jgi:hypothetical protein